MRDFNYDKHNKSILQENSLRRAKITLISINNFIMYFAHFYDSEMVNDSQSFKIILR